MMAFKAKQLTEESLAFQGILLVNKNLKIVNF
jgi:hypothetical protein